MAGSFPRARRLLLLPFSLASFENVKVDLGNDKHFIQIHGRIGQYTTADTKHDANDDVKIVQAEKMNTHLKK